MRDSLDFGAALRLWDAEREQSLGAYRSGSAAFIAGLPPGVSVALPATAVLRWLQERYGTEALGRALRPEEAIASPVANEPGPGWIRGVNMAGVNVRTVGSFWRVVHYALTLPACQQGVHLLPIWEPGVVSSLYGMASWRINPAFFDAELAAACPWLDTAEAQLAAVVNVLHLMGKTVGMDVIPHADRYSEIVLANPAYFEWLRRENDRITDHSAHLHEAVENLIRRWLARSGQAPAGDVFALPEPERLQLLFGAPEDQEGRTRRRAGLVDWLFREGYEPVPATMGPPYRGLEVDPSPEAQTTDYLGRVWRDYRITAPQEMSRVFGPLTRYKFYESLDDNREWGVDFSRPRPEVWDYFCNGYAGMQRRYRFDFMRGDMSHVQMRPEGVPFYFDEYYDPHLAVKTRIARQAPWFAYFAESFLAGPNFMAYGDEVEHLEASQADVTLGDLQSMVVGEPDFMAHLRRYLDVLSTRRTTPCFTLMTGDKDDPRFDKFYLTGNEARFFFGLFVTDMPSYMGLGFEQRDPHPEPAPNEHYTKLYVFQIEDGPKATRGPYQWGRNGELFRRLDAIRRWADGVLPQLAGASTRWLLPPDPTAAHLVCAWTQASDDPGYVFVVNFNLKEPARNVKLPRWTSSALRMRPIFSTHQGLLRAGELSCNAVHWLLPELRPGEGMAIKTDCCA